MKRILIVPALAALVASSATAGMTITWSQTGTVITGVITGSVSSTELSFATNQVPLKDDYGALYMLEGGYVLSSNGPCDYYNFYTMNLWLAPDPVKKSFSSGISGTGDTFGYHESSGSNGINSLELWLPRGYTAGTAIASTLTINGATPVTDAAPFTNTFTFGDIITLGGVPFVTFVDGNSISAVPEVTSTFTTLGLITSGLLLRRRTRNLR